MEREESRRRAGDDGDDPEAAESTLGKDCAMVDVFTEMAKEEFSLADLSNGPVVEAVYRSCRYASDGPEICLLTWLPKYRVPFRFTSHTGSKERRPQIDYPKYGFDRTWRSLKRFRNNFTASRVSSWKCLEARGGHL